MLIMGTVIFREKSWLRSLSENYEGGGGGAMMQGFYLQMGMQICNEYKSFSFVMESFWTF